MTGKTYKLDKYRAEAQLEPFELEVADGQVISIQPPSAETMMAIGETPVQDGRKMLRLLCGEQYEALWAAVAWEPAAVVTSLVKDLIKHFGLGEAALRDVPGGSRALPR